MGRKQGLLTRVSERLKDAPAEARSEFGKRFNTLKSAIEPRLDPEQQAAGTSTTDSIDITLPGTRRALGAEHPNVAADLNDLADFYYAHGRAAEAGPLFQRALAIFTKTLGADHPTTRIVRANLEGLRRAQAPCPSCCPAMTMWLPPRCHGLRSSQRRSAGLATSPAKPRR